MKDLLVREFMVVVASFWSNTLCHCFLASEFLLRNQLINLWDFPYVICHFSVVAFNIAALSLIFANLFIMCLCVFILGFILSGTFCAPWTWLAISFPMLENFSGNLFKYFSGSFSSFAPSGTPKMQMFVQLMLSKRSLQFSSVTQSCSTLCNPIWTIARQASLSITNCQSPQKFMSIESVMPFNHLILCHPLLLPSIFPSIRVFSNESSPHISWPKYWSFSFNISPSNEHPGMVSFRMDWLDLLAVQGARKSLLQHHSSKASILLCSAFFIVQLSQS